MEKKKLAIFANSDNYSDFRHMLSIIMAATSNGMEVNVFFSHGSLNQLIKEEPELSENSNPTEKSITIALKNKKIQSHKEILKMIKETGSVKMFACSSSVAIMNIAKNELLNVDKIMGLTTFLIIVEQSDTVLYI